MRRFVLALLFTAFIASPVQARNDNDRGNSNSNNGARGGTTTTTIPVASGSNSSSKGDAPGKSESSGKSDATGKSNSTDKSNPAGKSDETEKLGPSGKAGPSGNSSSSGASNAKPAGTSKPEEPRNGKSDVGRTGKTDNDDDADDSNEANDNDGVDDGTPKSYIIRFATGVRPGETGKALIDGYNDDVKKSNAAAQATAARVRAGSKAVAPALKARGSYVSSFDRVLNAAVVRVPAAAVPGLSRNPRVLSIEADASVKATPLPVSQENAPWGLDRIDQRALPLSSSFASPSDAAGVSIYIVDTGIDASHREFGGRVASGFDAINGTDGRTDCNSHGTHVAGTAGSATYGVAKSARLVPVRVLGCDGSGTYAGVIAGLEWIAQNRPTGERAVVNMSLGGGASSSMDAAVASLVSSGITVVVAAGNSNVDACTTSPARAASAITVGATSITDTRASYSNYGPCLDLFSPGSNILSTVPNGSTATYSGTSMAAPHVAGVAAVVLSQRDYSPSALAAYLVDVATTGVVGSAGTGSPNLLAYVPPAATTPTPSDPDPIATVPAQPATPIAESRNKAVVVSWTIPADGGSAIVGQIIRAYTGGRVVSSLTVDGATSSTRVTRLRNGVDYTFTVQARNAVGLGLESAPSTPVRPAR